MKLTNRFFAIYISLLVIAVINSVGCSSTGIQRSEKASTTMETMDKDIQLVSTQLDAIGASLDELIKPGQSVVVKSFELFTDNVSEIVKLEKNFAKHADEMKARGKDYFQEWQKEGNNYQNPEIQKLSEQRRIELDEIYGMIAQNSLGVKEAFKTYVSDVTEIQMYLSNDLTSKGIEAIVPTSNKVVKDGDNLKNAIRYVKSAIDKARAAMAQSSM